MARLTKQEQEDRLRFDYQVITQMNCEMMTASAYRTAADMKAQRNAIQSEAAAHVAIHYRVDYRIKTLSGRGQYMDKTTVHMDVLSNGNYPYSEPSCWVISSPIPWSPHFKTGYPVCTGEIWHLAKGQMLLGQLLVHITKLLNFDEVTRGSGYHGWNKAAIDYWQQTLKGQPITPDLTYPVLPTHLTHGQATAKTGHVFRPAKAASPAEVSSVFRSK